MIRFRGDHEQKLSPLNLTSKNPLIQLAKRKRETKSEREQTERESEKREKRGKREVREKNKSLSLFLFFFLQNGDHLLLPFPLNTLVNRPDASGPWQCPTIAKQRSGRQHPRLAMVVRKGKGKNRGCHV